MKFLTTSKLDFLPYRVSNKNFSEDDFWKSYEQIKKTVVKIRSLDGFDEYRKFISRLRSFSANQLVPLKDLMSAKKDSIKTIALRFDVDMEPVTAVRLARYNARYGIPASFFLLHTAYYYGVMKDKVFYRNPLLKYWLKALIVSGCEIGLHTDALSCYLEHGVDGAMAVVEEIAWLRSHGAHINGTVAHNSYPAYNAENFEIFNNYVLWERCINMLHDKRYPLGLLDEAKLGLTYEGNYPIRPKEPLNEKTEMLISNWSRLTNSDSTESEIWMRTYLLDNPCYERAYETIVWHHGGRNWTIATKVNRLFRKKWYWKVNFEQMFQVLANLPDGIRIVFLLHPIYFSRDTTRLSLDELSA